MGLLDALRKIAQTLRIIHVAPAGEDVPKPIDKIPTRSITLKELISEIRADDVRSLADAPAELTVALDKVCDSAGVKSLGNGWTIDKLRDTLRTDKFKTLQRNEAQRALIELFAVEKVDVQQLAKDAVARDQAIDAFAKFVKDKMQSRSTTRLSQIHDLESQLSELKRDEQQEQERWKQWLAKKKDYEKDMAWAIGYLLDNPIVTIDD